MVAVCCMRTLPCSTYGTDTTLNEAICTRGVSPIAISGTLQKGMPACILRSRPARLRPRASRNLHRLPATRGRHWLLTGPKTGMIGAGLARNGVCADDSQEKLQTYFEKIVVDSTQRSRLP